MKRQRYTLNDVAEYAGVSYQTVSRVVNNHPSVSPKTRARVQKVIRELGYHPNKVAKSLVANQSNTLAIMTFGMNHYGPTQMVLNTERAAKNLGYDLIFSNINEPTYDQIRKALSSLIGRQVDGILAISPVVGITYEEMLELCWDIPIVQIDPQLGLEVPSVIVDQKYGSRIITEHLINLGHQKIAEISGPLNWFGAIARHEQWLETMHEAGLTPMMSVEGDWSANSGYEAARKLLMEDPGFTALVVGNDQMTLGAIYALYQHNLSVPGDVSVVGFDDIPESAFFSPPLTTVKQDFNQLGEIGVKYLLERIHNPDTPIEQHVILPKLIVRQSTKTPSLHEQYPVQKANS
ncbi:MAG: LacI family DNA-binding transcriptional regulator [Anaerolineae bacterium]|nr:MAG: LacI family DNA-binding transcriptional regulator [Anaerolineae bacterium]